MLTVWEAIKMRRSIRKFAPDDVPEEMIEQMLEAARLAPSANNRQPWCFLVVKDKEVRKIFTGSQEAETKGIDGLRNRGNAIGSFR